MIRLLCDKLIPIVRNDMVMNYIKCVNEKGHNGGHLIVVEDKDLENTE